jgi:hypothetical protein
MTLTYAGLNLFQHNSFLTPPECSVPRILPYPVKATNVMILFRDTPSKYNGIELIPATNHQTEEGVVTADLNDEQLRLQVKDIIELMDNHAYQPKDYKAALNSGRVASRKHPFIPGQNPNGNNNLWWQTTGFDVKLPPIWSNEVPPNFFYMAATAAKETDCLSWLITAYGSAIREASTKSYMGILFLKLGLAKLLAT